MINKVDMVSGNNIQLYFQAMNMEHNSCLINECRKKAIKAHSVQNSRVLDLLCQQGHVICIALAHDKKSEPSFQFKRNGRNDATTFKGLCNSHDTEIFKPIECNPIDYDLDEHLFLISYRSILWECHAKISAARKYSFISNKIKGDITNTLLESSEFNMQRDAFIIEAWRECQHKLKYDFIYEYKAYEHIRNNFWIINTNQPTIAAAAVITAGKTKIDDFSRATLNVFPLNKYQTIILLSWLIDDDLDVARYFENLLIPKDCSREIIISKLLIQNSENFVISPKVFGTWSEEKKSNIIAWFSKNLGEHKVNIDDSDVNLF
jgi:hypothetical protein